MSKQPPPQKKEKTGHCLCFSIKPTYFSKTVLVKWVCHSFFKEKCEYNAENLAGVQSFPPFRMSHFVIQLHSLVAVKL